MNIYRLYNRPHDLLHHDMLITTAKQLELDVFWEDMGEFRRIGGGERDIANSARFSYLYAKNVLDARFPEGEEEIAKDGDYAIRYAKNVINGGFPKGEDAIAKDVMNSMAYARLIDSRFEKGEPIIAKTALRSWIYAAKIIKDRFPLGEPTMKDTKFWEKYIKSMAELGIEI